MPWAGAPAPAAGGADAATRDAFAASIERLLKNRTSYEPEDMLDENGERKSVDQLLAMAKLAPMWSLLTDSEKSAVQYTAGVLKNDVPFIVRKPRAGDMVRRARPIVMTVAGPVTM